jgi:hypothetical protein
MNMGTADMHFLHVRGTRHISITSSYFLGGFLEDYSMKRLCVFCGSSAGVVPEYCQSAIALAQVLHQKKIDLVYGGGSRGLMGVLANTFLSLGGQVTGVIPAALVAMEAGHTGLTDLRVVGSMHERKALMSNLSDGFVALPGGFGTFEELFEVITWAQIGLHSKPIGILNVKRYFDPLLQMVEHAVAEGFIPAAQQQLLVTADNPEELLTRIIEMYRAARMAGWS